MTMELRIGEMMNEVVHDKCLKNWIGIKSLLLQTLICIVIPALPPNFSSKVVCSV